MAGSTDVALETADVVLLDGGLAKLDRAFQISDEAMANVRQNLGIIIVPNAIAICSDQAFNCKPSFPKLGWRERGGAARTRAGSGRRYSNDNLGARLVEVRRNVLKHNDVIAGELRRR